MDNLKEDIKQYIEENKENENYNFEDIEEVSEQLFNDLWIDDSVTGNGSGSYYCNAYKAREVLTGNEDLLVEALEEFGNDPESYKRSLTDPEFGDVTIRCYLLRDAIGEVLKEMEEDTNKTIIKIIKYVTYADKTTNTQTKKELYKTKTADKAECKKILNDEKLSSYNSKVLKVWETIEASYSIGTDYKKIYKEIDPITHGIKKNY